MQKWKVKKEGKYPEKKQSPRSQHRVSLDGGKKG